MSDAPILPDNEPVSLPSQRTVRGGDPDTLGRIDHYDLLRKLGGGGFGVVYLARDTVSGVEVALKTLHPLLKRNAEEMDLLREKFRLVHGLTHPNIAKALVIHLVREINVWDDDARAELKLSPGDSVMVMDYAPGVTLSKWRRQFPGGVVPFDLALEVGRQVAAALDYAHSERIVHRDVKPSNVMVETVAAEPRPLDHGQGAARSLIAPTLRVRILDFGLAAEIRSSMSRVSTESGDTSGTRPYMAPEQWLGRKQDGRTDQYALACVFYELLSGAPPFAGVFETGDPAVMMAAIKSEAPDPVPSLHRAANTALLRALAKDPSARFPTCTAFVAALSQGRGVSTKRPLRRAGWIAAALLAAVAGVFLTQSPRSPVTPPHEVDSRAESAESTEVGGTSRPGERSRGDESYTENAESAAGRVRSQEASSVASPTESKFVPLDVPGDRKDIQYVTPAEGYDLFGWKLAVDDGSTTAVSSGPGADLPSHRKTRSVDLGGGVSLEMVACPGVSADFWMGKFEVTQEQWQRVMGSNLSRFKGAKNPVENVSWDDCQEFIQKLNALPSAKASGFVFRLPTEAEWETACRAGAPKSEDYCLMKGGEQIKASTLSKVARFNKSWSDGPVAVGSFQPNAWGLYDMHGNVCEWTDTAGGAYRLYRGGSFNFAAVNCSAGSRSWDRPVYRLGDLGFRLAASGRAATK